MAQWIRRLPTEQKIQGSNPCAVIYFFLPFPGKGKGVATLPRAVLYYQCVGNTSCTVPTRYHSSKQIACSLEIVFIFHYRI